MPGGRYALQVCSYIMVQIRYLDALLAAVLAPSVFLREPAKPRDDWGYVSNLSDYFLVAADICISQLCMIELKHSFIGF